MQNDSSTSFYNRMLSSSQQVTEKRQIRKDSLGNNNNSKSRKSSVQSIKQTLTQQEPPQRPRPSEQRPSFIKKKPSNIDPSSPDNPTLNHPTTSPSQLAQMREQQNKLEKMEDYQRRDYLATKVTPVLNRMLVKIVNHKPVNTLGFMIDFLKGEEEQFEKKRFNDKAPNDAILKDKHLEEVFQATVASKFLKFKK